MHSGEVKPGAVERGLVGDTHVETKREMLNGFSKI